MKHFIKFYLRISLVIYVLLIFIRTSPVYAQFLTSPDWFIPNTGSGNQTYSWQQDSRYYDALAYDVSMIMFDLHNFDCFNPATPEKCFNSMQRCPVPRTKNSGSPDNTGWDNFMSNFNYGLSGGNGYCTSYDEMIGASAQYPTTIINSSVFNNNFSSSKLANREGYFLESYASVPKSIRRSATAIIKQIMNGVKNGIPTSSVPASVPPNSKMTCTGAGATESFKSFRNFSEYPDSIDINPGNGINESRRPIKGPVGFYDCAQRTYSTSFYPSQGVDFTIRDRGNNSDFKCVDKREIYFENSDCTGLAYVDLNTSTQPAKDFYRFRSSFITPLDVNSAVVDLNQPPYNPSTSNILAQVLSNSVVNPYGVPKSMINVLDDFANSSGFGESSKKAIVVAYFTEILDRTIYFAKNDEVFRRTLKFNYTGGPMSPLSTYYKNFIDDSFQAGPLTAPHSKMTTAGVCVTLTAASVNGKYFGYLDRLGGDISDYSGYVMRPYRDIDPAAPASDLKARYVNTIETKTFGAWTNYVTNGIFNVSQMSDFIKLINLYYPMALTPMVRVKTYGTLNAHGPNTDSIPEPIGKDCGPPEPFTSGTNIGNLINVIPPPSGIACKADCPAGGGGSGDCNASPTTPWSTPCNTTCYPSQQRYEPIMSARREWWTQDGYADKSGFLSIMSCSPDEMMLALGKEDPTTSFTSSPKSYPGYSSTVPLLNPNAGGTNPYCASLDGSDPPKCVRVGVSALKENFNKYCVRYLIGKSVRRDPVTHNTLLGPFGNILFDMSTLNEGAMGGAMVCEDDKLFVEKASSPFPNSSTYSFTSPFLKIGPYSLSATVTDSSANITTYDNHLNNNAYFFKESQNSSDSPRISVSLILEQKYNSPDGEMTIPARSIGLGNPDARLPMNYGVCVRPKLEPDFPLLQMGPLSVPFRNYIVDYLIRNTQGTGSSGTPPNCP